jgi:regulator of sigma E protease
MDLIYFIVLVGVLIFVHESGHFLWAKLFGVRVLKFSLGFGPRIAGFTRGDTEYVIAALPLGGYVHMLGENPHDEVQPEDESHAFHSQALWKRVVIVFAGPLMNLTFPLLLFFFVFMGTTTLPPAQIGEVIPGEPADGKLEPGDRVVAIDGERVETFQDLSRIVSPQAGRTLRFTIERGNERFTRPITPSPKHEERPLELSEEVGRIGVSTLQPLSVIGVSDPNGAAKAAGLETFDWVVSAGGKPCERWVDLERALDKNRGSLMPLGVLRPERVPNALGSMLGVAVYAPRVATLTPEPGEGNGPARAGLEPAALYLDQVAPNSPEAKAGLRSGDRLVSLDGHPVRHWTAFKDELEQTRDREHELVVKRGGELVTAHFRLERQRGTTEYGQTYDRYVMNVRNWTPAVPYPQIDNPSPLSYAFREALKETTFVVKLTAVSIALLVQGRLSMKSLGGPLEIFDAASDAARQGAVNYLFFMGFISVNLGLLNLLPIPMLDGGHLMFLLIELVARRPLSLRWREYASIAGLTILFLLMVLAFKNDVERRWPGLFGHSSSEEMP